MVCAAMSVTIVRPARAADSEADRLARLEAAVQALQSQNAELRREISALKKEGKPPAAPPSNTAPAGPDAKAVVEQKPQEKAPVFAIAGGKEAKLVLGGFVQGQFDAGDVSAYDGRFPGVATTKTKDRFRLRRARINLTGEFAEQFDFKLEGGFETSDTTLTVRDLQGRTLVSNTNRTSFGATDVWVNWHGIPEANVKLGQFKAPFGLEQLTSDTKLFQIERSAVTEAITPERQIGVQVWGKPFANVWPEQKDLLNYAAGIFNGSGRNSTTNDNNEFMYVARLEAQPYNDKIAGQDVTLKLGANYMSSRDERGVNISQTGNLLVNNDGSLSAFVMPGPGEREGYGIDGSLRVGPFEVAAEYLSETVRPRGSRPYAFSSFDTDGYYVTGSYFILPKKLQVMTKWETFDPGQRENDDLQSITGGLNYYIKGDDLKVMADYVHTWSDYRHHNPQFGADEFDEVFVRMQVVF